MEALKHSGYKLRTVSNPMLTEPIIKAVNPVLILVNRQPDLFDSIPVFMKIKEDFPQIPVLLYALKNETGVRSLKHAIKMAFQEARGAGGKAPLPVPRMSQQVTLFSRR